MANELDLLIADAYRKYKKVLIWPAPPLKGGLEVYFSVIPALKIRKLKEGDAWLKEMMQYC